MNMKKIFTVLASMASICCLTACSTTPTTNSSAKAEKKINVVTTFYPMYDFAKQVAGDKAEVTSLIDASVEPHDYEPSAKDIAKISEADVFVYSSEYMETWVKQVLANIDTTKVKVVDASKGIDLMHAEEEEHEHEGEEAHEHEFDPHIWLDPVLAKQQVTNILEGIIAADTANKDSYTTNAQAFTTKLEELDKEYQTLQTATNKTFVTQHEAFGYLAHRYGLTQKAIAGISPNTEPTPAKLAELQAFIKENNVTTLYFEELASPKIAELLSKETGASLEVLSTLEGLSKEEQDKGADYISVMKENLAALKKAIQ